MKHPVINAAIAAFFGTCCTFNPTVAPRPVTIINIDNISQEDIDTLAAIIKNSPDWAAPRYMLGQIAEGTGHLDTALQLFSDCIQLSQNPEDEELYKDVRLMKAGVFEKTGRMGDALKEYLELGQAYPEDNEISRKVASLQEYDTL